MGKSTLSREKNSTPGANPRSTNTGQKHSSEEAETAVTKRRNTSSSSGSSPRSITEDDISRIVTTIVQALPGRVREIPKRTHSSQDSDYQQPPGVISHSLRDDEESTGSSTIPVRNTAGHNNNNPAGKAYTSAPHDFGKLTILYRRCCCCTTINICSCSHVIFAAHSMNNNI